MNKLYILLGRFFGFGEIIDFIHKKLKVKKSARNFPVPIHPISLQKMWCEWSKNNKSWMFIYSVDHLHGRWLTSYAVFAFWLVFLTAVSMLSSARSSGLFRLSFFPSTATLFFCFSFESAMLFGGVNTELSFKMAFSSCKLPDEYLKVQRYWLTCYTNYKYLN